MAFLAAPLQQPGLNMQTNLWLLGAIGGMGKGLLTQYILPSLYGMAGNVYLAGSVLLGFALLYYCVRLACLDLPVSAAISKLHARHLLRATVLYLPLLFLLMIANSKKM